MFKNRFQKLSHYSITALVCLLFSAALPLNASDWVDVVVTPSVLMQHFGDKKLVIVDSRDKKDFVKGHIPGAVNIPVSSTFQTSGRKDHVGNIGDIQRLFGAAGIGNDDAVIIYDDGKFVDAARTFWVFEVYGHRKVAILSVGYDGWVKREGKTSRLITENQPARYIARINPDRLSTKLTTRLAVQNVDKVLLDARAEEEYLGLKSESRRFGHIPGAMSIPWKANIIKVNGINTLKNKEQLGLVYKNIDRNKKVITYCNKGKQSSLTYLALRRLGYDVSHYDGSWSEWGNDPMLPITTPKR